MNINDENNEKVDLMRQIDKYRDEGFDIDRHCSMSDDINEIRFQLALIKDRKSKFLIEKELKYYELLLTLSGQPIHPRKELLKLCYGSDEFFEYHKQQLKPAP